MTQIPPRGTPEFEEYKKHVEEAHRNGAKIEIDVLKGAGWEICQFPAFDAWHDALYRIAPDQPQFFRNQAPEPSMTPTEQRIVKALDQIVYGLGEVFSMSLDLMDAQDKRVASLHDYTDEASKLVTALVADLPLPSPSEAPASPTAPAVEAGTGGCEAVNGFTKGDSVLHREHGWTGSVSELLACGFISALRDDGETQVCKPVELVNLTRWKAVDAAGEAVSKVLSPLNSQIGGSHYKDCAIQPVEFITANKLSFLEGCIVKRICRHRNKNGVEDLRKAIHEIELLIELEYGKEQA